MGASVFVHWPQITEDQIDAQPGFFNDCKAWGNWMAEREGHPDVIAALRSLDLSALLTLRTEGVSDDEVDWATPDSLARAAEALRALVLARDPRVARVVETYAMSANGVDPAHEELARDLADIVDMMTWARAEGATRVTLDVNW